MGDCFSSISGDGEGGGGKGGLVGVVCYCKLGGDVHRNSSGG